MSVSVDSAFATPAILWYVGVFLRYKGSLYGNLTSGSPLSRGR